MSAGRWWPALPPALCTSLWRDGRQASACLSRCRGRERKGRSSPTSQSVSCLPPALALPLAPAGSSPLPWGPLTARERSLLAEGHLRAPAGSRSLRPRPPRRRAQGRLRRAEGGAGVGPRGTGVPCAVTCLLSPCSRTSVQLQEASLVLKQQAWPCVTVRCRGLCHTQVPEPLSHSGPRAPSHSDGWTFGCSGGQGEEKGKEEKREKGEEEKKK